MTFEEEFRKMLMQILQENYNLVDKILPRFPIASDDVGAMYLNDKILLLNVDVTSSRPLRMRLGLMNWFDYGRYSVHQNITDILSSSGIPIAYAVCFFLPKLDPIIFKKVTQGIIYELAKYEIKYLGGDTKPGNTIRLVGTMLGITTRDKFSPRWNAKPGDKIILTNYVGLFALAGYILSHNELKIKFLKYTDNLKKQITNPYIPYKEALFIRKIGANAGIDISDGLSVDLYKVAKESKVSMRVYLDRIPIHQLLKTLARSLNLDPYKFIFNIGGDYQIIYTIDPKKISYLENLKQKHNLKFPVVIGEILEESEKPIIELYFKEKYLGILRERGHLKEFDQVGFDREIEKLISEELWES